VPTLVDKQNLAGRAIGPAVRDEIVLTTGQSDGFGVIDHQIVETRHRSDIHSLSPCRAAYAHYRQIQYKPDDATL